MLKLLALVVSLAVAPLALANAPLAVKGDEFATQREQIQKGLADGKTYAEISRSDQMKVRNALDRMSTLLPSGRTVDSLTEQQKVELFNEQEIVNTVLTRAKADSRVVCERIEKTGSHRRVSVCTTVAERDRRRQRDQDRLQNSQQVILKQGG